MKRVTVVLEDDLVEPIDAIEENRSRFIEIAVVHELERRRRQKLERSLSAPHAESDRLVGATLSDWFSNSREDGDLLDSAQGKRIRWHPGHGWIAIPY